MTTACSPERWIYSPEMMEPITTVANMFNTTVLELRAVNPQLNHGATLLCSFDQVIIPASAMVATRSDPMHRFTLAQLERTRRLKIVPAVGAPQDPTSVTLAQLSSIVTPAAAGVALEQVNKAMKQGNVNTPIRQCAFLANVAHESGGLTKLSEAGNKSYFDKYEPGQGPGDNVGNTKKGDGWKFRGRGMIQLTGRQEYTRAWMYFELPMKTDKKDKELWLFKDPLNVELAADPDWSAKIAGWFWDVRKNCNPTADTLISSGDELKVFKAIVKKINGGYTGLDDRLNYYKKAKKALGVTGGSIL